MALGQMMHCRGNELVDALAARVRPAHEPKKIEQYLSDQQLEHTTVEEVVRRLSLAKSKVKLPEKPKVPPRAGCARKRKKQPVSPHH